MSSVLVGMFDSQAAAEDARSRLLSAGFAESEISLAGGSSSGTTTSRSSSSGTADVEEPHQEGAITRFFHRLFGDDGDDVANDADTYREAFRRGSCSVTVTSSSDEEMERAERILNECGAVDIDEKAQLWRQEGWGGGAATAMAGDRDVDTRATRDMPTSSASADGGAVRATSETGGTLDTGETRKLQEVEEQLAVGKRTVSRGGVRIFSRVVETPAEESVTLREEHASVQRRAVDRPATEADLANFKEGTLEVRETAEEAVVGKSARVVGEVEIGKTATEREETVRETVRRTRVDVEPIEGGSGSAAGVTSGGGRETAYAQGSEGSGKSASSMGANVRDAVPDGVAEHPVGTGVGVAGGMAAGAAVGSAVGPAGTAAGAAVGAAVGAVTGGLAGEKVAEETNPKPDDGGRDTTRNRQR